MRTAPAASAADCPAPEGIAQSDIGRSALPATISAAQSIPSWWHRQQQGYQEDVLRYVPEGIEGPSYDGHVYHGADLCGHF